MTLDHRRGVALALLLAAGCAVDPSGLGADRTGADLGGESDMAVDPPDGRVPDASMAEDMFVAADLSEDSFVPPPDMCMATDEICNDVDDDCDGSLDEGLVSVPCDGDDDGCLDGMSGCSGGSETCEGDRAPMAGDACDGPDADTVEEDMLVCDVGGLVCVGECTPTDEVCDRRDNDCDGEADEGRVCDNGGTDCTGYTYDGHVYLFCVEGDGGDSWNDARGECRSAGYELVQVDDAAELAFLRMHTGSEDWWSDARADTDESDDWDDRSRWFWNTSGDPVDSTLWDPGEPSGNGRCAYLRDVNDDLLDDAECDQKRQFICEASILP